eukprot:TRINITY_DN5372_c0_g1_i1.p1 TRINITY_DN5372_c0_g1~~TRINITY_DN5372_c0_g1_i1.p1  ORF type:complete len:208 (+),score=30.91 TRINITY_DN5372_c0_g1_i1:29-625(+)
MEPDYFELLRSPDEPKWKPVDETPEQRKQRFKIVKQFTTSLVPFNALLGLKMEGISDGIVVSSIPYKPELIGDAVRGALHGGFIASAMDATAGSAVATILPQGFTMSTIDIRVDYLRPGLPQKLFARGTVQRMGSRVGVVRVQAYQYVNKEMVLIADGKAAFNLAPLRLPAGWGTEHNLASASVAKHRAESEALTAKL